MIKSAVDKRNLIIAAGCDEKNRMATSSKMVASKMTYITAHAWCSIWRNVTMIPTNVEWAADVRRNISYRTMDDTRLKKVGDTLLRAALISA
jgi:hypothetical protein